MDDQYPVTDRTTRRAELAALDDLTIIIAGAEGLERRLCYGDGRTDQESVRLLRAIAAAATRIALILNAGHSGQTVGDQVSEPATGPYAQRRRIRARDN